MFVASRTEVREKCYQIRDFDTAKTEFSHVKHFSVSGKLVSSTAKTSGFCRRAKNHRFFKHIKIVNFRGRKKLRFFFQTWKNFLFFRLKNRRFFKHYTNTNYNLPKSGV